MLALRPRKRFAKDTVLIVAGTLVPTRDHTIAERSKNYRYSTNHQVVIDADTRLVVVVGRPLAGNRNDCKAWEESGAKAAVGKTLTIADGGVVGLGLERGAPDGDPLAAQDGPEFLAGEVDDALAATGVDHSGFAEDAEGLAGVEFVRASDEVAEILA